MVLFWVFHENLRFFEFSQRPELEILRNLDVFPPGKGTVGSLGGSKSLRGGTGGY
jgi:hypothetical protein